MTAIGFRAQTDACGLPLRRLFAVPILFLLTTCLQLVDLLSSTLASTNQWEINPFVATLGESVSAPMALAIAKGASGVILGLLYAIWTRIRMDSGFCFALSIVAMVYAPTVVTNVLQRW
jgi:hypothetical protein